MENWLNYLISTEMIMQPLKMRRQAGHDGWLMSIILVTWEGENGRFMVRLGK
jgi:hypothetical protein